MGNGMTRWLGLSGSADAQEEELHIPLAAALSSAQKVLISVVWAAVCCGLFFFFMQMNVVVLAVLLAVSLFSLGLAIVSHATLQKQGATPKSWKKHHDTPRAKQWLGYSCRLEGVMAFLSGLLICSGVIVTPSTLIWGAYVFIEVVVLCRIITSDPGRTDAWAVPSPRMVYGIVTAWLVLLAMLVLSELRNMGYPDQPPMLEPFMALIARLVPIWMIPRGVIRLCAGVMRTGKLRWASLMSGVLLVCVGFLVCGVLVVPREYVLVVGIVIAAWGLAVAALGLQLSKDEP